MGIQIKTDDNREIDEVNLRSGVFGVQLERMDANHFCLIIDSEDQQAVFNIISESGHDLIVILQELSARKKPVE